MWFGPNMWEDYNVGDEVRVKSSSQTYTQKYAGTKAKIIRIRNNKMLVLEGFDGNEFECPSEYVEYVYKLNIPPKLQCDCGAKHTSFPNYHLYFCSLYKEKK